MGGFILFLPDMKFKQHSLEEAFGFYLFLDLLFLDWRSNTMQLEVILAIPLNAMYNLPYKMAPHVTLGRRAHETLHAYA